VPRRVSAAAEAMVLPPFWERRRTLERTACGRGNGYCLLIDKSALDGDPQISLLK